MKIKVCGITNSDDAAAAIACGADALGFVFVRSSPRFVSFERASAIIAAIPPNVLPVGVFVNEPRDVVEGAIRLTGIRALQLHGEETPEETVGYGVPVIKAHRVGPGFDLSTLRRYRVHAHLFDARMEGLRGGTGRQCDWSIAAAAGLEFRIVLSGGLHPENVETAVRTVKPVAVDVSSGVEKEAGIKDHGRMRAFGEAARRGFAAVKSIKRSDSRE